MVERQFSKLHTGVRFPLPAQNSAYFYVYISKEHFRFDSKSPCARKDPNCPVDNKIDFWADPNGKDNFRVYKNTGTALEVFGEMFFAACQTCLSHHRVTKLDD
jgi:hypothetical protein